jgi:hypothetical protein
MTYCPQLISTDSSTFQGKYSSTYRSRQGFPLPAPSFSHLQIKHPVARLISISDKKAYETR